MDSPMLSPMLSPTSGTRHWRARFSCRRIDRMCCSVLTYSPLPFVCGVMTWAVYTYSWSICWNNVKGLKGTILALLGLVLYLLANWSYLAAVFTNPGSPLENKHAYASLPTTDTTASITVKKSGHTRFCKKCQCYKPDRTHHCSSCNACVLKMDHHCPWLANCLGLYNYKSFLLFLVYTSLFCILTFLVSALYVYREVLSDTSNFDPDDFTPVNWVLLCVIGGIIGLVLSGFTIWHLTLVGSGTTTIESLEKARYTTPCISNRPPLPAGATHLYENAANDPHYDYESEIAAERAREFRRYNAYVLDESVKRLPHPFDLGRSRNFRAVFGGCDNWWVWFFPVFSGIGDGWVWETSSVWRVAAEKVRLERERLGVDQEATAGWDERENGRERWSRGNRNGLVSLAGTRSKADRILGKQPGSYSDGENVPLQRIHRDDVSDSEDEMDEERVDLEAGLAKGRKQKMEARSAGSAGGWAKWDREADDIW